MKNGNVIIGYQFITLIAAENGMSVAPLPHNKSAAIAATPPMAPKTRCPVMSISIMDANIKIAINSYDIRFLFLSQLRCLLLVRILLVIALEGYRGT